MTVYNCATMKILSWGSALDGNAQFWYLYSQGFTVVVLTWAHLNNLMIIVFYIHSLLLWLHSHEELKNADETPESMTVYLAIRISFDQLWPENVIVLAGYTFNHGAAHSCGSLVTMEADKWSRFCLLLPRKTKTPELLFLYFQSSQKFWKSSFHSKDTL